MLNAVPNRQMSSDTPSNGDRPSQESTGGGSQNPIYQRYLPLVRRITMRLVRKLPPEVTLDDLLGAGWVGLVEALRRRTDVMDEEQFEAYASHRIRGAILDYLRSLDPMSRKLRGASRQISSAIKTLSSRLGRPPEEEEIAGELGLALETYRQLLGDVAQADMARIELTDLVAPATLPDAGPDHMVTRAQLVQKIAESIDELPDRLKLVIGLYYQEELNLKEIGLVLEVTESRVCQLPSEAIHRIRAAVEDDSAPASSKPRMRLRSVP